METNSNNMQPQGNDDERQNNGEREENAFSQPQEYEDENGAGGTLGTHGENDNPGGAGSTGSAATNDGDNQ